MLPINAEGEAKKVRLLGVIAKAIVGKITDGIRLKIEDRERLFLLGSIGSIAAVEKDGEVSVGRDSSSSGEIINGPRIAGQFAEDFSIGNLCARDSGGVLGGKRNCGNHK